MIEIHPIARLPEIRAGDDLAALIGDVLPEMIAGDILAVTSKAVSKAEGRFVDLAAIKPGAAAIELAAQVGKDPRLIELVLAESSDVVRAARGVLITRHRLGHVMANAGIDASNIGSGNDDRVLLLPRDPDASAAALADRLAERLGLRPAVVITDSFGRPWRAGVVNVAIGCSGLPALEDQRGQPDRDGRVMQVTQVAWGDLIASAAGLAMGEGAQGIAAVVIRGLELPDLESPAAALIRPVAEDLFR